MSKNGWKRYKLSQIMDIIGGGTPKTTVKEYWGGSIPWLSVLDFGGGNRRVYKTEKTITKKGLEESSTKILKKGQVIISARGTVGEIAQLGCDMAFNQSCYGLDGKRDIVGNDFLYYLLKVSVTDLKQNTHGAVFDTITRQTFDCIDVDVPPLSKQKEIAKILSDLDEKIELNHQMNKTLESIAQAVFKKWFVDFEFPCLPEGYSPLGAGKPDDMDRVCTYKSVGGLPAPHLGKHFIYVLLCNNLSAHEMQAESFYIGITDDLYYRWYQHKTGRGAKWTKANEPIKLIHWEEFSSRSEAAQRERLLKTGFGRKWIKREYDKYLRKKAGLPAPECQLRQAGQMVDSELGEIPEGWVQSEIGKEVIVKGGTTPSTNNVEYWENGDIAWCTPKDLSHLTSPVLLDTERKITKVGLTTISSGLLPSGILLLSSSTPIGYLAISEIPVSINQGFIAILCEKKLSSYFMLYWIKNNLTVIKNMSGGSTFQEINKATFRSIRILVPYSKAYSKSIFCLKILFEYPLSLSGKMNCPERGTNNY